MMAAHAKQSGQKADQQAGAADGEDVHTDSGDGQED